MEWAFSGIGTEVIVGILGLIFGAGGWIVWKKIFMRQQQISGHNSKQMQIGTQHIANDIRDNRTITNVTQTQIAGNRSNQIQIGEVKYVRK